MQVARVSDTMRAMMQPRQTLILVIDDEEDFRAILQHVLTKAGYRVVQASGGLEGLERFLEEKPDLVVVDLSMPDIDGFEVTRRIRSSTRGGDTPVVMSTVRSQLLTVSEGLSVGVTDYVLKPFETEDFLARVGRALRP